MTYVLGETMYILNSYIRSISCVYIHVYIKPYDTCIKPICREL